MMALASVSSGIVLKAESRNIALRIDREIACAGLRGAVGEIHLLKRQGNAGLAGDDMGRERAGAGIIGRASWFFSRFEEGFRLLP